MLTAVVLAHNEEKSLPECLTHLNFCDAIMVIDDQSTDGTTKTARRFPKVRVVTHSLDGDFSAQRNFALSQVKSGWILFVDADEVVSPALGQEICRTIAHPECVGFYLPRLDILWGQKMRRGDTRASLLRLARKGAGIWTGRVHESWQITGRTGSLIEPLLHYPHPTVTSFLHHLNYYSTLKAREFYDSGRETNVLEIVFGPIYRFLYHYLFRLGFLDGTPGFISAMMMAFYMFLVAGKLYLARKNIPIT